MSSKRRFAGLVALLVLVLATWPGVVQAQYRGPRRGAVVFVGGYFYDPFFGPYPLWSAYPYPYPYYGGFDDRATIRIIGTPRDAAVYVDGYYAGIVDDFDGTFQSLPVMPGGHDMVIHREGYRTVHQQVYARPGNSQKLRFTMEPLQPGEASEPPPVAASVPPPPPGTATPPRTPQPRRRAPPTAPVPPNAPEPPEQSAGQRDSFGTLSIRVQPSDAEVRIDGQLWRSSDQEQSLIVQVAEGRHLIEIERSGFRKYSTELTVRRGATSPLNVSLTPDPR